MQARAQAKSSLEPELAARLETLTTTLGAMDSAVIAFSGGVDSSLLLRVAVSVTGLRSVAVTTASPTNTEAEIEEACAFAREVGARHLVIPVDELDTPGYAENPPDRCFLCKQTLYPECFRVAAAEGLAWVCDGVNTDDLGDYRPGLRAAAEMGVRHPLVEAGLSKADIRTLSAWYGLGTAEKPASPCLSSRFPYGTRITHEGLALVARAEAAVRSLGFEDLRVRYYGDTARVEIAAADHARLADATVARAIEAGVRAAGFARVEIAAEPLRSGSLNDVLRKTPTISRREGLVRSRDPAGE
jgi:uncharacterized protein